MSPQSVIIFFACLPTKPKGLGLRLSSFDPTGRRDTWSRPKILIFGWKL